MADTNSSKSNQIELSLELVRLSQERVRDHGVRLDNELARQVAEAAIIMQAEELDFILDESATMSQSNVLSGALGVNDIVVNGRQIDVRPLMPVPPSDLLPVANPDGGPVAPEHFCVSIDRLLVGTPYLAHGSLVVQMQTGRPGVGRVVGYITPSAWLKAEAAQNGEAQKGINHIFMPVEPVSDFDLGQLLSEIVQKPIIKLPSISRISDVKLEVGELVNNREKLISARQKQILAYLSTNWTDETMALVESVPVKFSRAKVERILGDSAAWQGKSERLVEKLAGRFPELGKDEVQKLVLKAGERYGSQLTAPRYRRALLAEMVALCLAKKNAKNPLSLSLGRAQALAEKVLSGISAIDAVKNVIGNQMAVDLAFAIQKQRKGASLSGLIAASAEELGLAYGQLALAPAYATHSQGADSGLDSVNEALALIEASQLAEGARAIEMDLANF
jgi:hypothetical protein